MFFRKNIALTFVILLLAAPALAQTRYPSAPIKLIVPSTPGGVHDVIGRLWAERLTPLLGTIVVENQGGAGGAIGVGDAARAPADGYTLLLGSNSTHILNPLIMKSVRYDPFRDFDVVSVFATTSTSVAVSASSPWRTPGELIDDARANPGKFSYAHGGVGAISHVTGELFKSLAGGLAITPVPYKGMGPAQADVMGAQVPLFFPNVTGQVASLDRNGNIRVLAVNSATRHKSLPAVPTAIEAGVPGMIAESFFAIFAPAGLPADILARINAETGRAFADPQFREKLAAGGFDPVAGIGPDRTKDYVRREFERWAPLVKSLGVALE